MRIPKLPFHNVIVEMLYALFFQGDCLKYVSKTINDSQVIHLEIPDNARYAVIVIESQVTQFNKDIVVRFREDGHDPDASNGMPLGDMGVYEVKGTNNMSRFKMIGVEANLTHQVRIQYFG
ncbi:MAG TPA: hypothetical protein VK750_07360 [Cytophagaceae bacterium]|jgi:hypothetical protein|nr:hypothetical protein [Cytophagaceae bacterium]